MSEDFKNLKQIINKFMESSGSDQFEIDNSNFEQYQFPPESLTDSPQNQSFQSQKLESDPFFDSQKFGVPSDPPKQTPQPPTLSQSQTNLKHPVPSYQPNQLQPSISYPPPYPQLAYPQHPYQPPYLPYSQPQPPYPQPPYPPYTQPQPPYPQPPYPPYQHPYSHQAQYPYQQAPYPHQYPYGGVVSPTINRSEEEELEEELREEHEKARKLREYQEKQIADMQRKLKDMQINQNNSDVDKLLREFALENAKKEEYIRKLEQQAIQAKTRTTRPTAQPTQPIRSSQPTNRGLKEPNVQRHCVTSNQDNETAKLMALQEQKKAKLNQTTAMTNSGAWNTVDHQKEITKLQEQQRNLAKYGNNAAVRAKLDNVVADIASFEKVIDLAILMDCTHSMYPWMSTAKDKIVEIADKIKITHSHLALRMAFVAYRDFNDKCQIEYKDFSTNADEMKKFISTLKAEGGGDIPEDVAGGLENCLFLSWKSRARLIIHFADAPPHGRRYHNHNIDNFPYGDPQGRVPESILEALCMQFKVDYYFARLNSDCDMMLEFFKPIFNQQNATMKVIEIGASVGQFVPLVMESVSATVYHTVTRAPGRI